MNPGEIHLQLAKTEKTSKETNIEYLYRMQEIASRINLEEEAEKFYLIKGLKEDGAIEMQLKSSKYIQELKEKMKILESKISTTNRPEFINPKYPMKRTPPHLTQLAHRSQYESWRSDPNQPPMSYSRNQVYNQVYPQRSASYHHHPSFIPPRPTMYPRSQWISQQRLVELRPDAPTFHPSQQTPRK
ncbi:hypothetical protein TNCT_323771 [Trichonephila clavata]|uniref:Uncharacterized protein n=1 Tax=Trichonephila clavata TaxID=2740835 RepID=A0A8X6HYX6_TRICU|nr:hypothetical protein TNCT_323771 [Trichonephila clavata]